MRIAFILLACLCLFANSNAAEKEIKHKVIKGEAVQTLYSEIFGTDYHLRVYCGNGLSGLVIDIAEKVEGNRYQSSQRYYSWEKNKLEEIQDLADLKFATNFLRSNGLPLITSPLSLSKSAVSLNVEDDHYTAFIFEQKQGDKKISVLIWDMKRKQLLGNMHSLGEHLSIIGLADGALPKAETLNQAIERIYLLSNFLANNITEADLK
ncbi:hypothetical protein Rhal01_03499 [Rubritalea halochordaticola]|uniref:Uncharacterized protein n=1 Tax=Rubritalea halochordaticola TaxID=714537 RepID=A0ABP9V3S1_9BACT